MYLTLPVFLKLSKYPKLSCEKYAFPSLEMSAWGNFLKSLNLWPFILLSSEFPCIWALPFLGQDIEGRMVNKWRARSKYKAVLKLDSRVTFSKLRNLSTVPSFVNCSSFLCKTEIIITIKTSSKAEWGSSMWKSFASANKHCGCERSSCSHWPYDLASLAPGSWPIHGQ